MTHRAISAVHARVIELTELQHQKQYTLSTLSHGEDGIDNTVLRQHLQQEIADIERRIDHLLRDR